MLCLLCVLFLWHFLGLMIYFNEIIFRWHIYHFWLGLIMPSENASRAPAQLIFKERRFFWSTFQKDCNFLNTISCFLQSPRISNRTWRYLKLKRRPRNMQFTWRCPESGITWNDLSYPFLWRQLFQRKWEELINVSLLLAWPVRQVWEPFCPVSSRTSCWWCASVHLENMCTAQ